MWQPNQYYLGFKNQNLQIKKADVLMTSREFILSPLDDSPVDCAPGRCIKITTCRLNSTALFFGLLFQKKSKKI